MLCFVPCCSAALLFWLVVRMQAPNIVVKAAPSGRWTLRDKAAQRPLPTTLGASVMEAQLSNQQRTIFDAVHHAVLVRYAA